MFANSVRAELARRRMSQKDLEVLTESGKNVINRQLVRDDFRESRMQEIADVLGLELIIELRPKPPCRV